MNPLEVLPIDVVNALICCFLDDKDVLNLQGVSKAWNVACNQPMIWKTMLNQLTIQKKLSQTLVDDILTGQNYSTKKAYWVVKKRLFEWDFSLLPTNTLACLELSNSNKKIHKVSSNSERYITVRGNSPFRKGTGMYRWKIRVSFGPTYKYDLNCSSFLKIGVCYAGHATTDSIGYSKLAAGYGMGYKWRMSQNQSSHNIAYGHQFKGGDIVECVLNTNASTLSYIHNSEELGVAFKELPDEVYPAVSLDYPGEIVELDFGI